MKIKNILHLTNSVWDYSPGETSSHMSFIELESFLIMVDTGMDPDKAKLMREFAEEQTGKRFKFVLITHHHGDHTFGTKMFKDCDIISSKSTKEILSMKIQGDYKDKEIVLPNIIFEGEYKIEDGSRIVRFIETNGHTQGSSFVYIPDENTILTGDLLFAKMFPFAGDPSVNPYLWVEAFQQMIDLKPNIVIPGHGPISSVVELKEGQKLIKEMLEYIEG
ncbi:MAG: MBL fold metallo-hydrolase, partial [Candidatus Heimdallarchaeota archaeon]|nr:MBL fold metallo-hydrolase [Candidatus Heimdallarchaeota archaeon]